MTKERKFTPTEMKILRVLYQTKAPLTVYEIAKEISVSFPTVKKYVTKLVKEGAILEDEQES